MIPQIHGSFEEWLANPLSENNNTEFKEDFKPPKNSEEAFERYGLSGESFYRAIKEAEYQPKIRDGKTEMKYNPAFKNIDAGRVWQLWANNGTPFVKDKGFSDLITKNESSNFTLPPEDMDRINKVIKTTGASMIQSKGNPLLASLTEFPLEEEDTRTQGEKDLELFENATEMAYETITGAMDIITKDN